MLDDSRVSHGKSTKEEAHGDTSDWPERNANLSEEGVEQAIADGDEDDNCERINVLGYDVSMPALAKPSLETESVLTCMMSFGML